jgi:DNA-binding GntR family transcriptional regulator
MEGVLPAGSRLSEISVANEIGISKTPVREAFRRLEEEGLVEQVPRFGTIVRVPTRREIIELYEYREALETYAVRLAASRIMPKELDLMDRMCREQRQIGIELRESGQPCMSQEMIQRSLSIDMAYHMALLGASHNRRIIQAVEQSRVFYGIGFIAGTFLYHRRILRALRKHDGEEACYWMGRHVQISREEAVADFDRRQTQGEASERFPLSLPPEVRRELDSLNEE